MCNNYKKSQKTHLKLWIIPVDNKQQCILRYHRKQVPSSNNYGDYDVRGVGEEPARQHRGKGLAQQIYGSEVWVEASKEIVVTVCYTYNPVLGREQ